MPNEGPGFQWVFWLSCHCRHHAGVRAARVSSSFRSLSPSALKNPCKPAATFLGSVFIRGGNSNTLIWSTLTVEIVFIIPLVRIKSFPNCIHSWTGRISCSVHSRTLQSSMLIGCLPVSRSGAPLSSTKFDIHAHKSSEALGRLRGEMIHGEKRHLLPETPIAIKSSSPKNSWAGSFLKSGLLTKCT